VLLVAHIAALVWPQAIGFAAADSYGGPQESAHSSSDGAPAESNSSKVPTEIDGEMGAAIYVRTDTDTTTVVSPQVRYRMDIGPDAATIELGATIDAWSSASVDIRTAATPRVRENRVELTASGSFALPKRRRFGVGYRYSQEPDYLSNAVNLFVSGESNNRRATITARVFAAFDAIGRSGDKDFFSRAQSVGGFFGWTHVLSGKSWLTLGNETRATFGFQSSPYRLVALGGPGPGCAGSVLCIPEIVPRRRVRNATEARVRFALRPRVSLGATYRFYADSWSLLSHTGAIDLGLNLPQSFVLAFESRIYKQGPTNFYRATYPETGNRWATRDRELSPLLSFRNLVSVSCERKKKKLGYAVGVLAGGTYYRYFDFLGLERVFALELGLNTSLLY